MKNLKEIVHRWGPYQKRQSAQKSADPAILNLLIKENAHDYYVELLLNKNLDSGMVTRLWRRLHPDNRMSVWSDEQVSFIDSLNTDSYILGLVYKYISEYSIPEFVQHRKRLISHPNCPDWVKQDYFARSADGYAV